MTTRIIPTLILNDGRPQGASLPYTSTMLRSFFILLSVIVLSWACTPQNELVSGDEDLRLSFSQDTVFFDTLFTSLPSTTQRFRIINPNEGAVNIDRISLSENSGVFSMIIHGKEGNTLEDIYLRGGDSLMVLVEARISASEETLPFVIEEQVVVEANGHNNTLWLQAWGQNAYFHRMGERISSAEIWAADRPHVVMDSLFIEETGALTIEKGSKIYFNNDAYMLIRGSLNVEGTPQDTVTFQHIRREEDYDTIAGQWLGLYFTPSSKNNRISGAYIKNAYDGVYVWSDEIPETPAMIIENTTIENMASSGVFLAGTYAKIHNSIINNCIGYVLACASGGKYELIHNTIANYNHSFRIEQPTVGFSSAFVPGRQEDPSVRLDDLSVKMENNIIWGDFEEMIILIEATDYGFDFDVNNNILRTSADNIFGTENFYESDPGFYYLPFEQQFFLAEDAFARDKGLPTELTTDRSGEVRDKKPDLGALEWRMLEE
ncbi:right-handed parallel beta-helix repeat-containing protein [Algivirga pacifica]|uniref:Right handed beta helix domain-containing protein n=1 Tax=Algivirga pacifica TaxID=1162670 RepID=A0ABP9DB28_9BACT